MEPEDYATATTARKHAEVTITVTVDGTTKTFTADATTTGNEYIAAEDILNVVKRDMENWLRDRRRAL